MAVQKYYLNYSSATCWSNKKKSTKSLSATGSSSSGNSSTAQNNAEANARLNYNNLGISTSNVRSGYGSSSSTYTSAYRLGDDYSTSKSSPSVSVSVSGPQQTPDGKIYTATATAKGTGYATRTTYATILNFTASDLIKNIPANRINSATIVLKGTSSSASSSLGFYAAVCNSAETIPNTMITDLTNYTTVQFTITASSSAFTTEVNIGTLVSKMIETGNYYIYLFHSSIPTTDCYFTLDLSSASAPNINYNWGNSYTLSYNVNGGQGSVESYTKCGLENASFTISTFIPTLENYQFLGWDTNSAATTATYHSGDSIVINTNTTLYAIWAGASLILTFDARGGTVSPASQGASYDAPYGNLPIPIYPPYKFIAWATKPQSGRINASTIVTNPDNHILYAQWYLPKVKVYEGTVEKQIYIKE